jgi:NAD(P)-dependent dehydrogenase (short-subunit alcohol dehydrogenase family)
MVLKRGDVAVIVGAATGIGRAAARKWAANGVKLALFDYNERVANLAEELKDLNNQEVVYSVGDVKKLEDLIQFKETVYKVYEKIDLLFLNAGIGFPTHFSDPKGIVDIVSTNFFGLVNGVGAFHDAIVAQNSETHVILTGSKQGITNPPGNPGYNASKAAVKSFAEGLSHSFIGTKNEAHLLIPGWVFTNLTGDKDDGKPKPAGAWAPEQVVDYMDEALSKNTFYILCPDNDVTVELDKKRMAWNVDDVIKGRPALSRWRDEYKAEFQSHIEK